MISRRTFTHFMAISLAMAAFHTQAKNPRSFNEYNPFYPKGPGGSGSYRKKQLSPKAFKRRKTKNRAKRLARKINHKHRK